MRNALIISLLVCMLGPAMAQQQKPKNRAGDFSGQKRRFHFGFTLGYNRASFDLRTKPDFTFEDSLLSLDIKPTPGFNLGIISSLHLDPNWKLRFIPTLSFQDRSMNYRFLDNGEVESIEHRVESTFIDFPLLLKWRTDRINNWCVYLIGGGAYSIDMASREDVDGFEPVVKIKKTDYSAHIGGGVDFFLPYFKFGVELKVCAGIPNVHLQDNNFLSNPISSIRTKVWLLSFTFEG